MKRKIPEISLAAAALSAFAWAGYGFWAKEAGPALTVQPTAYQPDAPLPPGQVQTVRFHLDNRSRHPLRVVGLVIC